MQNRVVGDKVIWVDDEDLARFKAHYGEGPFTIGNIRKHGTNIYYDLKEISEQDKLLGEPVKHEWDHLYFTDPLTFTMTCTNPRCKKQHTVTDSNGVCGSCYWDLT
jgi:hypothetical protein